MKTLPQSHLWRDVPAFSVIPQQPTTRYSQPTTRQSRVPRVWLFRDVKNGVLFRRRDFFPLRVTPHGISEVGKIIFL